MQEQVSYTMKRKVYFIFLFPVFFSFTLFAQQKTFSAGEIESIVIKAVHLNLKFKSRNASLYTIKWTGKLSFQKKEKVLKIQSSNFNTRQSWKPLSSGSPAVLEISGPSLPVQLFSFSSKASFSRWTKPVFISLFKGTVRSVKSKGLWKISLKEGSINIHKHEGSLFVQGFHINQQLTSSQGQFQFYTNEGRLKLKQSEGQLNFITDKAGIELTQFKGSLKGFSQSGAIQAVLQPDVVELFAGKGPLRVSVRGYSPSLKAYTEKGKIYGPAYLYKQFSGKSTEVSGRLRGYQKKGKLLLKSETGNIYIN